MKINMKKEDFEKIESCFSDIKEDFSKSKASCNKIENILNNSLHKKMTINIINPSSNNTFFVMSIFPEKSTLDKIVEAIVNSEDSKLIQKIWEETNEWIIEIDKRVFDDKVVNVTPKEMTALLLHEIGHMVYSNSIPQRISRVVKFEFVKLNIGKKKILQNKTFGSVLKLPIADACTYRNGEAKDNIGKELKADLFVTKMGYGPELESILRKFSEIPIKSENDDSMKQSTAFSVDIINNFEKRKAAVAKKNLNDLATKIPSEYIKSTINDLSNLLFSAKGNKPEEVRMEYIEERANEIADGAYITEFFDFRVKKFKRIDPRKIDYIDIQRQNIRNNDDKMILLNYIYTNLDKINYYLAILDNPEYSRKYRIEDSREQLEHYKNRLLKSRDIVVNYKIPEVHYGIEITYPAGYEG